MNNELAVYTSRIKDNSLEMKDDRSISNVIVEYRNNNYVIVGNKDIYLRYIKEKQKIIPIYILNNLMETLKHLVYRTKKEKLNPIEIAYLFEEIKQIVGLNQKKISEIVGKTQGNISNKVRLLTLPFIIQQDIIDGRLTERHGRAMLQLVNCENEKEKMNFVYNEIINKKLNVSQTETVINKILGKKEKEIATDITQIKSKRELKNRVAVSGINQLEKDIKTSLDLISKYYPELKIDIKEGIKNKDYIIEIKLNNVN